MPRDTSAWYNLDEPPHTLLTAGRAPSTSPEVLGPSHLGYGLLSFFVDAVFQGEVDVYAETGVMQKGFFITVTVIPVGLVAWTLASSSDTAPRLTGFVQSFHERREELSRRHALHQAAREQAASDRHLFASASPAIPTIEVRHPE